MYSDLAVVTPPAVEPVSLAQARAHCRIDNSDDDTLVSMYISAARALAEAYCNRASITQTLRWTMARGPTPAAGWPFVPSGPIFVLPLWFNWADIGGAWLELPRAPIQSIASVTTGMWGQADTALVSGTDFYTDLEMQPGRVRLAGQPTNAQDHVVVQYTAGYGDTPDAVPPPIKIAILWTVAFLYENRGDTDTVLSKAALNILSPYRLVTFG